MRSGVRASMSNLASTLWPRRSCTHVLMPPRLVFIMVQRPPSLPLISREDAAGDDNIHPVHVSLEENIIGRVWLWMTCLRGNANNGGGWSWVIYYRCLFSLPFLAVYAVRKPRPRGGQDLLMCCALFKVRLCLMLSCRPWEVDGIIFLLQVKKLWFRRVWIPFRNGIPTAISLPVPFCSQKICVIETARLRHVGACHGFRSSRVWFSCKEHREVGNAQDGVTFSALSV